MQGLPLSPITAPPSFSSLARQVTSLQAKTKRTKQTKHRVLGDAKEDTVHDDRTSMRHLNERALAMGSKSGLPTRRHNASEVDVWAFKGVANFTRDPTTPGTIPANGMSIELSNDNGAILDTVTFAPTECKLLHNGHRVLCKHKGGASRLTLTQRKAKGMGAPPSFLPVWQLSGHFPKQDIVGDIAAMPLVVALYIDIAYVDSVPNCKVAKSGLTVTCKDTAAKL